MVQIQFLCVSFSLSKISSLNSFFFFSSNLLLSRTSLRQSIFHVSIFNNLSHPSSPLFLSQSFLNNDDANEELWCDQPRCDQPLSHSQAEEEKLWCEKIYGLSLTAEEVETDMDSPPLQRREGKKTRCRRDGKRRWRRGRSGGDDNSEHVRALVWRGRWRRRAGPSRGRRRGGMWRCKKKKQRFN